MAKVQFPMIFCGRKEFKSKEGKQYHVIDMLELDRVKKSCSSTTCFVDMSTEDGKALWEKALTLEQLKEYQCVLNVESAQSKPRLISIE